MWITFSHVEGVLTSVGLSVATIYGLLQWFGKSWINQQFKKRLEQLKHDQQKEIEQLRHEINALFSRVSKIHEKEFEVLPRAWTLLHEAHGSVFRVASAIKFYPEFPKMSEGQFKDFISSCRLKEYQKEELSAAGDRLSYYRNCIFWIELNDAKTAQIALNNYLAVNSIFMTEDLRQQFKTINQSLHGIIVDQEIGRQYDPTVFQSCSKTLSSVGDLFGEIESAVQKRLRYEEA